MNFSKKYSQFLTDSGVSFALFFVMLELIGINAYSIRYVLNAQHETWFNWIPATIGAFAYSITTIVVMQQKGHAKLKTTLPVLDALLVMLGMNILIFEQYASDTINYVALILSVLFAVFTAVITYSLGQINNEKSDLTVSKSDYDRLLIQLQASLEMNEMQNKEIFKIESDATEMEGRILELTEELKSKETLWRREMVRADNFEPYYIASELSRIRKMKPKNRNIVEVEFSNKYANENSN